MSMASATGRPRCYPPDRAANWPAGGVFATLETFVAPRVVAAHPGVQRSWAGVGGSNDRVPLGRIFRP